MTKLIYATIDTHGVAHPFTALPGAIEKLYEVIGGKWAVDHEEFCSEAERAVNLNGVYRYVRKSDYSQDVMASIYAIEPNGDETHYDTVLPFWNHHLDELDREYVTRARSHRDSRPGVRLGDYLRKDDGMYRFTHIYSDAAQITTRPGNTGSFYMGRYGSGTYSGALDPSVPYADMIEVEGDHEMGTFWFFHHGEAGAHRGVYMTVPCRVFEMKPGA